jgi:hypothetical protein
MTIILIFTSVIFTLLALAFLAYRVVPAISNRHKTRTHARWHGQPPLSRVFAACSSVDTVPRMRRTSWPVTLNYGRVVNGNAVGGVVGRVVTGGNRNGEMYMHVSRESADTLLRYTLPPVYVERCGRLERLQRA